jgi:hypothetical protein
MVSFFSFFIYFFLFFFAFIIAHEILLLTCEILRRRKTDRVDWDLSVVL